MLSQDPHLASEVIKRVSLRNDHASLLASLVQIASRSRERKGTDCIMYM